LAGCVTVNVSVLTPPTTMVVGANAFVNTGAAAFTVTQAPVVLVPLVALLETVGVMFTAAEILALLLLLFTWGQLPNVGVALLVTGTTIVHVPVGFTI
jgi:hypothetical protein